MALGQLVFMTSAKTDHGGGNEMEIKIAVTSDQVEEAVCDWVKKNHAQQMEGFKIQLDLSITTIDHKKAPAMMVGIEEEGA